MGKVRYLGASSMMAWEFSKALHLQKANKWARFVVMQDNYNLLAREEEREMLPLCADEGVQTIVYSPLSRGRLARSDGESTERSEAEASAVRLDEASVASDRKIIASVAKVARDRVVSMAQIALAWLWSKPVVAAPIIGSLKAKHIDDAVAALSLKLADEEIARLEAAYTPRRDGQGISDPSLLARATEAATGFRASVA
jgi:aryl-alcohol dehydrogenase-like predicted oxidoreductase